MRGCERTRQGLCNRKRVREGGSTGRCRVWCREISCVDVMVLDGLGACCVCVISFSCFQNICVAVCCSIVSVVGSSCALLERSPTCTC